MTKIGSKLLLTYFLLIICMFLLTSVTLKVVSQRYLLDETERQLTKEAKVISQILKKAELSNRLVQKKVTGRRALSISSRLMESKIIIWTDEAGIVYSDLKGMTMAKLEKLNNGLGKELVTETVMIYGQDGKAKGHVTLVAKLSDIKTLNEMMLRSRLIGLLISGLIALALGVFFEKKITGPIRKLSRHMKNYSIGGANQDIQIESKDEIGELAESFNSLSRKLKRFDAEQKAFFHNASHELKTPLMAIQGNAEGILDGVVTGEDVAKGLNVIIAESQRLKGIVEGITYLAKLENVEESFTFTALPLEDVIGEAVESIQALAEQKGLKVVVENHIPEAAVPVLELDPVKMKQAFINLLGNAIRYARSEIVIESRMTWEGSGAKKGAAVIKVCDDGPGLAPGEETKVFQRFHSGAAGGSGMGLAITKTIIEAHGGIITAANGGNGGAVFTITIPTLPPPQGTRYPIRNSRP